MNGGSRPQEGPAKQNWCERAVCLKKRNGAVLVSTDAVFMSGGGAAAGAVYFSTYNSWPG